MYFFSISARTHLVLTLAFGDDYLTGIGDRSLPCTRDRVPSTKHQIPCIEYPVSGIGSQVQGIKYQVLVIQAESCTHELLPYWHLTI